MTLEFKIILFFQLASAIAIILCMSKAMPRSISETHEENSRLNVRVSELESLNCELQNQISILAAKNKTLIVNIENLEQETKQNTSRQKEYLEIIAQQKKELLEKQRHLENCWRKIRILENPTGITQKEPQTYTSDYDFNTCNACNKAIQYCTCSN